MSINTRLFILLFLLFLFSALFSASEAALIALNKIRLRHMFENKKRGAARVYRLVGRMDKLIATVLVGNNLVNTAIAAIGTYMLTIWLGPGIGVLVATFLITGILVIFGELTPKVIATNHPEGTAFLLRYFVTFFIFLLRPVTLVCTWISNGFIRLVGGNPHSRSPLVTEEEMRMMITIGKEQGFYGDHEKRMLERIFHFDEIDVREVMTSLDKIISVPVDVSDEELERVMMEQGHNRLPVYKGSKDNIIGILYVRDLLYLLKEHSLFMIEDLISTPFYVACNKKVSELLREFQFHKIQIAIVRDVSPSGDAKSQKVIGLVTLEDLLEEIVGEIEESDTKHYL